MKILLRQDASDLQLLRDTLRLSDAEIRAIAGFEESLKAGADALITGDFKQIREDMKTLFQEAGANGIRSFGTMLNEQLKQSHPEYGFAVKSWTRGPADHNYSEKDPIATANILKQGERVDVLDVY